MIKEYLERPDTTTEVQWREVMEGFNLCHIEMPHGQGHYPIILENELEPNKMELFLCFHGSMMVECKTGAPISVTGNEIFLLSDIKVVHSARITSPLSGILIVVDRSKIENSLTQLNKLFLNHKSLQCKDKKQLEDKHACCVLEHTEWSQTFFSALRNYSLKPEKQQDYSVFKIIELFYLIHTENAVLKNKTSENNSDSYLIQTINNIKEYMESHLDERLTIDSLSERFHISATTLKASFREIYGMPIHKWLQAQRMKQAAKKLFSTNMTVLEIAQLVGYDGVSQFNVIFKRYYGVTPGRYRKMSNSVKI